MKQWIVLSLLLLSACDNASNERYQGYVEGENIYLSSPYSGVLVKKNYSRGQKVQKGEILFQLDVDPQRLILRESEADLSRAESLLSDLKNPRRQSEIDAIKAQISQVDAQLKLAAIRVKRFEKLQKQQASDKDSVDAAIARYNELQQLKVQYEENLELAKQGGRQGQINAQQALVTANTEKVKQSKWQLSQKTIYAPTSGVLFDTYFREGEFVPNQQPIASLLAPEHIQIEFFVPVKTVAKIDLGKNISFTCEGCDASNRATINYISPEAEYVPPLVYSRENYKKLVYRIKASIAHPMQFKPGQPVTVDVK